MQTSKVETEKTQTKVGPISKRRHRKACPKDDFPLPHIDVLIENAITCVMYSFMDGFSGYNQILMAIIDKAKTSFITE